MSFLVSAVACEVLSVPRIPLFSKRMFCLISYRYMNSSRELFAYVHCWRRPSVVYQALGWYKRGQRFSSTNCIVVLISTKTILESCKSWKAIPTTCQRTFWRVPKKFENTLNRAAIMHRVIMFSEKKVCQEVQYGTSIHFVSRICKVESFL